MPLRRSKRNLVGISKQKQPNDGLTSTSENRAGRRRNKNLSSDSAPKRRKQEPKKKEYVDSVRPQDVLKGRGPAVNGHQGNVDFRRLVKDYIARYVQSEKTVKTQICQEIVEFCKDRGIHFLEKEKKTERWFHVTDHTARTKAAQTIQDILKRRHRRKGDSDSEHKSEIETSQMYSGEDASNSDDSDSQSAENDDDDIEDEAEHIEDSYEEEDNHEEPDDLKLPALPVASTGLGTVAQDISSGMVAAAFPENAEPIGGCIDDDSDGLNERRTAQLRPAASAAGVSYLRQLSIEHEWDNDHDYWHS